MKQSTRPGRPLLFKLTLLFVSLLMTLAGAEVAVRVFGLAPAPPQEDGESLASVLDFDGKLETRYQPSSRTLVRSQYGEFALDYAFNELGLRDRPVPRRQSNDGLRILALGNSFVEGWGVAADQTFLRVAEDRLNREGSGRQVRVVNAGASGYGAAQCYLWLQELSPTVQPDAVVFFYVPTMTAADAPFVRRAEKDGDGLVTGLDLDAGLPPDEARPRTAPRSSPSCSHLVRFLDARMENYRARRNIVPGDPSHDLLAAYRGDDLPAIHQATWRHIHGMARVAEQAGLPFLLVYLPLPFEVSPVEWEQGRAIYGIAADTAHWEAPYRLAANDFTEAGLEWISARALLAAKSAQAAGQPRLYYAYDFHLNPAGNRVLGEWLAEQLAPRCGDWGPGAIEKE